MNIEIMSENSLESEKWVALCENGAQWIKADSRDRDSDIIMMVGKRVHTCSWQKYTNKKDVDLYHKKTE